MALPEEDHPLFDPPLATNDADYRARFLERMGDMDEAHAAMAEGFYLAQRVWDATMARSVVEAVEAHGRAILCVGSFHSDHDGGVVLEILARRPGTRLLVVSVVPGASDRLAREDHGRADVVVYSGSSEP
jgi:uncharacterized iron-regulated protein